ncbi:hypothetical protein C8R46DRAFT_892919 [Mycena filopes]|nr:hypothetical protein C8R46DRAFT_892919 [Mycena filopes]
MVRISSLFRSSLVLLTLVQDLFAALAPACFRLATTVSRAVFADNPHLKQPFPGPWTSVTFDLGPQTVTKPQWLCSHVRWCWLAITALGRYDPTNGGHIILWDLGRVLEFPPGSTILLPAILTFSIARIDHDETRYSFTQYLAAPDAWQRWPAATALYSKLNDLSSLRT